MAWFTVAVPLSRMGVSPIYLVKGQKVTTCIASANATAPATASPLVCWLGCRS
jgi:hypothetical protein